MVQLQKDSNRLYIYTPTGFWGSWVAHCFCWLWVNWGGFEPEANKKHQSSRKCDCSYAFTTTGHYLASTYVVSQHLGWWPEKNSSCHKARSRGMRNVEPQLATTRRRPWVNSATKIGGRFLIEMWQETTSKSPQTPKLEEAKVRGKSERLKSWNAVLFVFVFVFLATVFFCVVYVCHLKRKVGALWDIIRMDIYIYQFTVEISMCYSIRFYNPNLSATATTPSSTSQNPSLFLTDPSSLGHRRKSWKPWAAWIVPGGNGEKQRRR